jgi:hypothetical protein
MSGSTSFRFKKPVNWAYAPGLTKAGVDGSVGDKGTDGNAIYFIDYELNNSYNIELAQQKLENNYTLSGNSIKISEEREYHSGDLIVSDRGNCYRIEKGSDPYYTFSINYIGRISTGGNTSEEPKIVGLAIYKLDDIFQEYPRTYYGFLPNNREFLEQDINRYFVKYRPDTYISADANPEAFRVYGLWYKFAVLTDEDPSDNIEYTVEVRLRNKKSYHFNSVPELSYGSKTDPVEDSVYRLFEFNKVLEFSVPSMRKEEYEEMTTEDFVAYGGEPYFLSDMSLDKVHLFGNDIRQLVCQQNGNTYCSIDGITSMKTIVDDSMMQRHTIPGKCWPDVQGEKFVPAVYSSFRYASDPMEYDINWRGGESAYFSSMSDSHLTDLYKEIEAFVHDAEFRIVMHYKDSGEIKVVDIREPIYKENLG